MKFLAPLLQIVLARLRAVKNTYNFLLNVYPIFFLHFLTSLNVFSSLFLKDEKKDKINWFETRLTKNNAKIGYKTTKKVSNHYYFGIKPMPSIHAIIV